MDNDALHYYCNCRISLSRCHKNQDHSQQCIAHEDMVMPVVLLWFMIASRHRINTITRSNGGINAQHQVNSTQNNPDRGNEFSNP